MFVEVLGVIATLFIIVAFSLDDKNSIRILDIIGAVLFVIYGICIQSISVIVLNIVLICINIYKLCVDVNKNRKQKLLIERLKNGGLKNE